MLRGAMKKRLDCALVERGLIESRAKAQALIMAGEVLVDGSVASKAGMSIDVAAHLEIRYRMPYVSRGGLKLAGALDAFGIHPAEMVCMDVGASTGGFTDCLLQRGAKMVYAIDVGHGQLHQRLRSDPRVMVSEGVNFRYFSPAALPEKIALITIDVSFISLDKILPVAAACLKYDGAIVAMVKPQFEATPRDLDKGVVKDTAVRTRAIEKIKAVATAQGLTVENSADAAIKGPQGNVEHFLHLVLANHHTRRGA
jgi:23S rRNA (cytidine1920-2'-O)/16S rRNA (cytidine1409-2'-O)-methyltransferase